MTTCCHSTRVICPDPDEDKLGQRLRGRATRQSSFCSWIWDWRPNFFIKEGFLSFQIISKWGNDSSIPFQPYNFRTPIWQSIDSGILLEQANRIHTWENADCNWSTDFLIAQLPGQFWADNWKIARWCHQYHIQTNLISCSTSASTGRSATVIAPVLARCFKCWNSTLPLRFSLSTSVLQFENYPHESEYKQTDLFYKKA